MRDLLLGLLWRLKLRGVKTLRRHACRFPRQIRSRMPAWHLELGSFGEALAVSALEKAGLFTWFKNWTSPAGELDIVAYQGHTLVIAEVKTRTTAVAERYPGVEAVDKRKQKKLVSVTNLFLRQEERERKARRLWHVRFDIVEVTVCHRTLRVRSIRHIPGAFSPDGLQLTTTRLTHG